MIQRLRRPLAFLKLLGFPFSHTLWIVAAGFATGAWWLRSDSDFESFLRTALVLGVLWGLFSFPVDKRQHIFFSTLPCDPRRVSSWTWTASTLRALLTFVALSVGLRLSSPALDIFGLSTLPLRALAVMAIAHAAAELLVHDSPLVTQTLRWVVGFSTSLTFALLPLWRVATEPTVLASAVVALLIATRLLLSSRPIQARSIPPQPPEQLQLSSPLPDRRTPSNETPAPLAPPGAAASGRARRLWLVLGSYPLDPLQEGIYRPRTMVALSVLAGVLVGLEPIPGCYLVAVFFHAPFEGLFAQTLPVHHGRLRALLLAPALLAQAIAAFAKAATAGFLLASVLVGWIGFLIGWLRTPVWVERLTWVTIALFVFAPLPFPFPLPAAAELFDQMGLTHSAVLGLVVAADVAFLAWIARVPRPHAAPSHPEGARSSWGRTAELLSKHGRRQQSTGSIQHGNSSSVR